MNKADLKRSLEAELLKIERQDKKIYGVGETRYDLMIKDVLNYIDNSISKEVVENYLKDEKEKFEVYKKESENNENLKGQMWHHMGAKNMCERILGIEKLVTLD